MMRRVVLACASAAVVVLTAAAPANAAEAPISSGLSVEPKPDANGVIFTATPTVAGEFRMGDGGVIKTITINAKPTGDPKYQVGAQPVSLKVCGHSGTPSCGGKATATFSKAITPVAANGPYEITASATGSEQFDFDGDQTGTTTPVTVKVRAAPATPTDVKAVANEAGDAVTVSWARNSEPDITGYVPVRQNADGSFTKGFKYVEQPASANARPSFKDENVGAGGELKYFVFALRGAGEKDVDSISSTKPSDEAKVKVAARAAPTTTTAPGGGGTPTTVRTPATVPAPTPAQLKIGALPAPIISRGKDLGKVGTGGEFSVNVDDGSFNEDLPYGPGDDSERADGTTSGRPRALPLREAGQGSNPKALLVPLSAGAALCVVAFQLRFLNGRVTQPVDLV